MAENIPQLPFANERPAPAPQPNQKFSAEDIRSRLSAINNYVDTNGPQILAGIKQSRADQANYVSQFKDYMSKGTPDIYKVQNLVSGNVMTGPNPGLNQVNIPTAEYVNTLMNKSKFEQANNSDPYFFARPTSFNASKFGLNYDRYYSHPKFKELGFSIYRDNESTYNANSSWLDDFRRMGSKWFSLAYQGGSGLFKNWGAFGAYGEAEDAAKMENDLSIAMSSKGGAGAWVTNFLANSGYSVGIMAEIALEELVLAGATGLTGGVASPLAALRTGQNMARLGKSMKVMAETLSKADKAKSFWTATKGAVSSAGKALLPTETLNIGAQAFNPNSAFNRLNDFAKTTKTFGAFYRDMREINAVTAEARLEGGFAQNKVANDALDAFIKENNRMPNSDEAKVIADKAIKAGKDTMLYNTPAIYLSNKIVLDTALKGFAPVRRLMSKEGLKSNMYKLVKNSGWKEAGTKPMEVVAKGMFSSAKNMISKDYLRSVPSKLTGTFSKKSVGKTIGGGIRYFSANLMEGLQESYQEAVQSGVTDYYLNEYLSDLYSDPYLAENNSMGASIMKGIGEQFSGQGLDTFAQGFLMGGVMGGAQNIIMPGAQRLSMKTKDWYSKTNSYEEYQKSEKERLQKYADAYNDYSENPYKYVNWLDENVVLQRDLADKYQAAEETGDRKEAESAKDDSMFNHITTLLQTERYDSFIDQLTDLNELSDDELADAFNSTGITNDQNKKSPRERLDTAIKKSKEIKQRWEKINEKFENPYNPSYFDKEKDKEAYDLEVTGYQAFEIAKRSIAFNEYTFDRTISRLNSLVNNAAANGPLGNVAATDFSALYSNPQSFMRYAQAISSEIAALNLGDGPQKTLAKKKSTQLDNLLALKDLMDEFKNKLLLIEKAKQAVANPESASEESKRALEELNIAAKAFKKDLYDEDVSDDIAPDVIIDEFFKDKLYAAYAKYTKNIAGLNNVFPIVESIENSFADLVDYIKLDADAKHMSEFADIIANPMSIYEMSRRVQTSLSTVKAKRKELHLKGLQTFKRDILDVDELFQKMLDMGVYFDPEHIDAFKKDGTLPPNFIDAMTGEAIKKTDPKYNQVVALIEQEEKLRGVTFSNKPVEYKKPEEKKAETETPAETPEQKVDDFKEAVTYDITTEFNTFPDDIKNKLKEAHAAAMLDGATTDIQEWMLEDPDAALIISGKTPAVKKTEKTDTEETEDKELDLITAENPKSFEGAPAEFKQQFDELEKQNWTLAPDNKTYISKEGEPSKRVSDLKEGEFPNTPSTKASSDRGNFLDDIWRAFAKPGADGLSFKDNVINLKKNGETDSQVKFKISLYLKALSGVIGKKHNIRFDEGYIDTMSSVLLNLAIRWQDFNWYTSVPTMIGTLLGEKYGGTIDLMLEKDGNYYIIDLKTSTQPRRINGVWYTRNDQIQQNAYAELSEQLTGKPISGIFILNLVTTMTDSDNRKMASVELDEYDDADEKKTVLTTIPRVSIAELKGYTPEGTETPAEPTATTDAIADIEKRRQEQLKSIPAGSAAMVKFVADGNNRELTEEEIDAAEELIQAFIENGEKDVNKIIKYLQSQGFVRAAYVSIESQRAYIKARLEGAITTAVNGKIVNDINAKYDAELVAEYRKQEQAELAKAIPNMAKDYPDTYGDNKGKMPNDLYAIYKPIYDKYDKLITPLLPDTGKKETKQVDWNAVIDRATSAKEVDKIMDQIYAANASTPELIDRALVKKESFPKPDAKKVDVNALRADLEDKLRKLDQLELVSELNEDPYSNPIPNIYILDNLPRITPESARKETGTKVGTVKDINPSLLSKSGVSVRKAAEIIVEQGRTEEVYLEEDYVLNEILDILQLGKNEYRKRNGKVNKEEIAQLKAEIDELSAMLDAELAKTSTKLTVKELKDSLVRRLQAGETITGTISKPTGTPNNVFEFIEEGKPTVTFYNTGVAQITMDDLNKTATLRLVEKIVTEDKRQYYNVVEVYIGDKLIGNVQTTDFKANDLTNNIIMAATPGDLMNNFSSYIANKTIRSKFKYKAKDDTEQIYTFDEVIDLTKRTLSNMKITPEEKAVYLKGIDDLVNTELGMVEKKVSPEEKESAQNVIDDAADKVVDIDGASVNEAIGQTQQEVDDEFDNSLPCETN